ncbi:MAG: PIN domain-containing protein [Bacteroidales bacterium]|jgi:predicted nucleic acid-binding protein|nr:PIN domain-containing protein [Bacteroidales bacterium]
MENVFIDTDVIVDFLTDRKPFSLESAKIFSLIDQKKIKGCVSSLSFSNLYYVLRKFGTHKKVISSLQELSDMVDIQKVDSDIVKSALSSDFKDFEDSIQYFAAQQHKKADCIITRNIKDYKDSSLPVMTPETFLATFENTASS